MGDFREKYKSFPSTTLVVIASSDTSEYRMEAIEAAREELLTRGESWQDEKVVAQAKADVEGVTTGEELSPLARVLLVLLPGWGLGLGFILYCTHKEHMRGRVMLKLGGWGCVLYLVALLVLVAVVILSEKL